MKVALIVPPLQSLPYDPVQADNLGVGYLGAILTHNSFDVQIIDGINSQITLVDIINQLKNNQPELIGVSFQYTAEFESLKKILNLLEELSYPFHLTIGGHPATFMYDILFEHFPMLNSVVYGEGEFTLLELAYSIRENRSMLDIKGIVYRDDKNKVVKNPPRELIENLDCLPFPQRTTMEEAQKKGVKLLGAAVSSSRGCYGSCTFCSIEAFYSKGIGNKWRYRSPKNVVDEIEFLVTKFDVRKIFFVDDNFIGTGNIGKERAYNIGVELLKRKIEIKYDFGCRASDIDFDLFRFLRRTGLNAVFLGVESGSEKQLQSYKKYISVEENINAIEILSSLGVKIDLGFIMFDTEMDVAMLEDNIAFLRKIGVDSVDLMTPDKIINTLMPLPGTSLEERLREKYGVARTLDYFSDLVYDFEDPVVGNVTAIMTHLWSNLIKDIMKKYHKTGYDLLVKLKTEAKRTNRTEMEIKQIYSEEIKKIEAIELLKRNMCVFLLDSLEYALNEVKNNRNFEDAINQLKSNFTKFENLILGEYINL